MKKIPLIIDCDPGTDDAIVLALAPWQQSLDVKLITTVAGNVGVKTGTKNALHMMDIYNKLIPVVEGAHKPLIKRAIDAKNIHNINGLGSYVYDNVFTSKQTPGKATEHMKKVILGSIDKVTILATAPLTNIANLFNEYPECISRIERIIILGGCTEGKGNVKGTFAEFNFFVDPHAVQMVFNSNVKIDLCTLQTINNWSITPKQTNEIKNINKTGELIADLLYTTDANVKHDLGTIYDVVALMYLLKPTMFKTKPCNVKIELESKQKLGKLICDFESKNSNCNVVLPADKQEMFEYLKELVSVAQTQTEQTRPIIIDCDPGVDDAMALMYALHSPEVRTKLIATTGGNSSIESTTSNALHLVKIFRRLTPVAKGADKPLVRKSQIASYAHGKSGLGGYVYDKSKITTKALPESACDAIYSTLVANKTQKITIVCIGPMTNLALMLNKYPDAKKYIRKIVFQSGTKEKIYGRPYKSFNVGYDPEAAEVVFASGIPLVMVPMELGHFAYLDHGDIAKIKTLNKTGKRFAKMFEQYRDFHVGDAGAPVHDPVALVYLTHPEYLKTEKGNIKIKYYHSKDVEEFGYIDIDFNHKKPNAEICVDINIDMFKKDFFECLGRME